jgi:hypothetical protein
VTRRGGLCEKARLALTCDLLCKHAGGVSPPRTDQTGRPAQTSSADAGGQAGSPHGNPRTQVAAPPYPPPSPPIRRQNQTGGGRRARQPLAHRTRNHRGYERACAGSARRPEMEITVAMATAKVGAGAVGQVEPPARGDPVRPHMAVHGT